MQYISCPVAVLPASCALSCRRLSCGRLCPAGVLSTSCWQPAHVLLASCWRPVMCPVSVLQASCWRPVTGDSQEMCRRIFAGHLQETGFPIVMGNGYDNHCSYALKPAQPLHLWSQGCRLQGDRPGIDQDPSARNAAQMFWTRKLPEYRLKRCPKVIG